jgi:hypothetical protein
MRSKLASKIAQRYIDEQKVVKVMEEVFPTFFSQIDPYDRKLCSLKLLESLKELVADLKSNEAHSLDISEFTNKLLSNVTYEKPYTQQASNLLLLDVSEMFSMVKEEERQNLISLLNH